MTNHPASTRRVLDVTIPQIAVIAVAVLLSGTSAFGQVDSAAIKAALARQPRVVKASWWGFAETESTAALQAAINSGADKVIVENMGRPWIIDQIQLADNQEVFFEKGCVILAKRGAFHGKSDCLFTANLKQNVTLNGYGATFRMWKADYHTDAYTRAEWRHCLSIRSCTNVTVFGLTLADSGGDGIYLGVSQRGVTNTNVHIKQVVCDGNNRQGISVISAENLLIEDTVLKNTSGTPPKAAIDFEPNHASEKIVNCVMRNCVAEDNDGGAYVFYLPNLDGSSAPISVQIENCVSRGTNSISAAITTSNNSPHGPSRGSIEFVNCTFKDTNTAGVRLRDIPAAAFRVRFENCTWADAGDEPKHAAPIMFGARATCALDVGNFEFANCTLKEPTNRPLMSFDDYTGELKVVDVTGKLVVVRDGVSQVVPITEQLLNQLFPSRTLKRIPRYDLSGKRFVPVFPEAAVSSEKPRLIRQRKRGEYLVYANQGDEVQLNVRYLPVGKYGGNTMKVVVLNESDKPVKTLTASFKENTQCSFTAPTTGAFRLVCDAGPNCVHVNSPTHRLCLVGFGRAIPLIASSGDFYFLVPGDVQEFGVKVFGSDAERVNATVYDPSGKPVWAEENINVSQLFAGQPRTSGKDEVWRLRLGRPSEGVFEDNYIELRGIPCLLAYTPQDLLKPIPADAHPNAKP